MHRINLTLALAGSLLLIAPTARAADGGIPCGNIGFTGCCLDATHSQYCSKTSLTLTTKDCAATSKKCGWSTSFNNYTCVDNTAPDTDPGSVYPRMCSELPDGGIPDPDAGPKADSGATVPCGTITGKGCCDGETVKYCSSSSLKTKDCTSSPKCGWDSTKNYYTCGTSGNADPAGTNLMPCPGTTTPDGSTVKKDMGTAVKQDVGSTVQKDMAGTSDTSIIAPKKDSGTKTGGDSDGCAYARGSAATQGHLLLLLGIGLLLALGRRRRR